MAEEKTEFPAGATAEQKQHAQILHDFIDLQLQSMALLRVTTVEEVRALLEGMKQGCADVLDAPLREDD